MSSSVNLDMIRHFLNRRYFIYLAFLYRLNTDTNKSLYIV